MHYFWVFLGSFLVDVVPFPLPPAFTVMIFFQVKYDLNVWWVIFSGVIGSIVGRSLLTIYLSKVSKKIFTKSKNEDVQFLGRHMKKNDWKSQSLVLVYSLLPLPTTPLFVAAGMAKIKPFIIIPAFIVGKVISDTATVLLGKFAAENTKNLVHGLISWKSISGLVLGLIMVFALLFIDWRTLLTRKKIVIKFGIWK
jgi:membrane protein YqaA with SNARE-associated domain